MVAGQIQLHICGLAVGTLHAHGCESISPQVLHVFDMPRVVAELANQFAIVRTSVVPKRLLPLQHDHRETVRIGLFEGFAHADHRAHRRCVVRSQWHGMLFADPLQGGDRKRHNQRQSRPCQNDEK